MNYRTIDLAIEKTDVRRRIGERAPSVTVRYDATDIEYHAPAGFHVATLSDIARPDGQEGTRLKYRSVIISPSVAHVRRIAHEIRDAVIEHRY